MALRNFDEPDALLFDCDGVLVDTEKDGHRVSFNMAFRMKGAFWWARGELRLKASRRVLLLLRILLV
jgi:beta-phosphoglucomutase-like phosphatase (HAD superfamily)